jgi:hypothetical protein
MVLSDADLQVTGVTILGSTTSNLGFMNARVDHTLSRRNTYLFVELQNQFAIKKGAKLVLTISGVIMPPSLAPFQGIIMFTGDKNFNEIEKSFSQNLQNTEPGNDEEQRSSASII